MAWMTDRQFDAAVRVFGDFCAAHKGVSPTVRDLTDALGRSSTSVGRYMLTRMEEEGLIENAVPEAPQSARAFVLTTEGRARYESLREKGSAA